MVTLTSDATCMGRGAWQDLQALREGIRPEAAGSG